MAEPPVHKSFGEFYRLASIEPTADQLTLRWKAVLAFLPSAALEGKLDLVRFVLGLRTSAEGAVPQLRAACLAADPSFPNQGADLELKAIAAVALLHEMDTASEDSDALALSIMTGECRGHRPIAPFTPLFQRAQTVVAQRAVDVRKRGRIALSNYKAEQAALTALKTVGAEPTPVRDAAYAAITEAAAAPKRLHEAVATVFERVEDAFSVLAEESNILWWVIGEYSRDLGQPMSALAAPTAALAAAKELADLTEFAPGPSAAPAFLSRLLKLTSGSGSTTLSDAVVSTTPGWRSALQHDELSKAGDLCPILQAISKASETEGGTEWHPAFHKATKLMATAVFDPLRLSQQLFDELMLLRLVGED